MKQQWLPFTIGKVLNDPDKNQRMIKKLPTHIVARWSRMVDKWLVEEEPEEGCLNLWFQRQCFKPEYPPFSEFGKFMRKEARIASTPVTSPQALKVEETKPTFDPARMRPNPGEKRNFGTKTLATRSSEERVTDYAVNGLFSNAKRIAHCARQIMNLMCAKDSQTWLFLKEESSPILILFAGVI